MRVIGRLVTCLVAAAAAASRLGAQEDFRPNDRPSLEVRRAAGQIVVDGDLGDSGWVNAAKAFNFTEIEPRELSRPDRDTEAWIAYDADHLYVAIVARDDPGSIRSSLTDRDAMYQDDYAGILLDTYGDASWAYYILANPKGIQGDLRFSTSRGDDARFDIIYKSAGRVTADGYVVELAIPFASLRFPDRPVQTWRATFWRSRPRSSEQKYTWAATRRGDPCLLCQFGTLTGIEGIRPGGALELLPSAVAAQAGSLRDPEDPGSGFRNGSIDGDLGLTAKYSFKSGLTAEASLNPDFSQVESDASQVDVNTTFALSFPERRPFFQEGGDLLGTNLRVVYTRNINDPIAAVKLIQRTGRSSVAYLGARDDHSPILLPFEERSFTARGGKSVSNIVRGRRTFGQRSYLGVVATDRRLEGGGGGSVAGIDGTIAFGGVYQVEFQLVGSRTREPDDPSLTPGADTLTFDRGRRTARFDGESFGGYAQYTSLERAGRTWSFDLDYYASSPAFRADNGLETRNNFHRIQFNQSLNFYSEKGLIERIRPSAIIRKRWNFEGDTRFSGFQIGVEARMKGQVDVRIDYERTDESFGGTDFKGLDLLGIGIETAFSEVLQGEIFLGRGEHLARNIAVPVIGRGTDIEAAATVRPVSWIALRPSFVYSALSAGGQRIFSGYILRNRADLQFTRELFLRLVAEYDDFDRALLVEPLLTYRANPFTLVYIGSSRGYQEFGGPRGWTRTATQYFAKVQYLIRK